MNKVAISGLAVISMLALAIPQIAVAQAESSQEITVIAPQVSVQKQENEDAGFAKVMVYTAKRQVSFADLDLTSQADVDKLKHRLHEAARAGCEEISKDYPLVKDSSCVRIALDNANAQAERVIEAASGK